MHGSLPSVLVVLLFVGTGLAGCITTPAQGSDLPFPSKAISCPPPTSLPAWSCHPFESYEMSIVLESLGRGGVVVPRFTMPFDGACRLVASMTVDATFALPYWIWSRADDRLDTGLGPRPSTVRVGPYDALADDSRRGTPVERIQILYFDAWMGRGEREYWFHAANPGLDGLGNAFKLIILCDQPFRWDALRIGRALSFVSSRETGAASVHTSLTQGLLSVEEEVRMKLPAGDLHYDSRLDSGGAMAPGGTNAHIVVEGPSLRVEDLVVADSGSNRIQFERKGQEGDYTIRLTGASTSGMRFHAILASVAPVSDLAAAGVGSLTSRSEFTGPFTPQSSPTS